MEASRPGTPLFPCQRYLKSLVSSLLNLTCISESTCWVRHRMGISSWCSLLLCPPTPTLNSFFFYIQKASVKIQTSSSKGKLWTWVEQQWVVCLIPSILKSTLVGSLCVGGPETRVSHATNTNTSLHRWDPAHTLCYAHRHGKYTQTKVIVVITNFTQI